jgi:hypothetical protein
MGAFEYLSVLISIILALGMTRVLAGLMTAAITRNERYHEFYAVFFFFQTVVMSFLIFQTLV